MFFEPKKGHGLSHNPIAACVAPRPIGWISTCSADGINNLAPFSYFNLVHNFPPTVMFACNGLKADGTEKDSWINAEVTGEFVYNVATDVVRGKMNLTSTSWSSKVDEAIEVGLTCLESMLVKPMRIAESPIQFECKTIKVLHLPTSSNQNPSNIVFGEVVGVHIQDSCLVGGKVDYNKVKQICRLGYMDFAKIGKIFTMPRPYLKKEQS